MKRRTYDKHEPAPCSLYSQNTFTSRYISDHKNTTRKKQENDGRRASTSLCLRRGGAYVFSYSMEPPFPQPRCRTKFLAGVYTPDPLFHCPHALTMHFREWQQLKPPFPLPPCPERSFHPMPTPQTPLFTHPPDPVGFSHPPPCVQLVLIVEGTTARPAWIPRRWRCSRRSQACPGSRRHQHGRRPSRSPRRRSLWASPGRGQYELAKGGIRPRPRRSRCSPGVHPSRRPLPRHRTCPRAPWQSSGRSGSRSSRGKPPPPPPLRGSPSWSAASRSPPWTPQTPRPSPAPTPSTSPSSRGVRCLVSYRDEPHRLPPPYVPIPEHQRKGLIGELLRCLGWALYVRVPQALAPVVDRDEDMWVMAQALRHWHSWCTTDLCHRNKRRSLRGVGVGAEATSVSHPRKSSRAHRHRESPPHSPNGQPRHRSGAPDHTLINPTPPPSPAGSPLRIAPPPPPTGASSAETTTTRRDHVLSRRSECSCPKQRHALNPQ